MGETGRDWKRPDRLGGQTGQRRTLTVKADTLATSQVLVITLMKKRTKHGHFGQNTDRSAVMQASRWREVASAAS